MEEEKQLIANTSPGKIIIWSLSVSKPASGVVQLTAAIDLGEIKIKGGKEKKKEEVCCSLKAVSSSPSFRLGSESKRFADKNFCRRRKEKIMFSLLADLLLMVILIMMSRQVKHSWQADRAGDSAGASF